MTARRDRDRELAGLLTRALAIVEPRSVQASTPAPRVVRERKKATAVEGRERRYGIRLVEEIYQCAECLETWVITSPGDRIAVGGGQRPSGWWKCPNGCNHDRSA